MPEHIKIGIAGLGFGSAVHLPVFQSLPGVSVVGVAAARPGKAEGVAEKAGIPHACEGYEELLDLDLDAISIALPPETGSQAAAIALGKGLGVLMEKPLAGNADRAGELIRLAEGRTAALNYIFYKLDTFQMVKNAIVQGNLGRLERIDVVWTAESWANRNRKWSWKTDARRGGGVITTLGSHACFLAEWFSGSPIEVLRTQASNNVAAAFSPPDAEPAEDHVEAEMKAGNVEIGLLLDNGRKQPPLHRWVFKGQRGTAVIENTTNDYFGGFVLRGMPGQSDIVEKKSESDDRRFLAFHRIAEDFIGALRRGDPAFPDFATGLRTQRVMDALHLSTNARLAVP